MLTSLSVRSRFFIVCLGFCIAPRFRAMVKARKGLGHLGVFPFRQCGQAIHDLAQGDRVLLP